MRLQIFSHKVRSSKIHAQSVASVQGLNPHGKYGIPIWHHGVLSSNAAFHVPALLSLLQLVHNLQRGASNQTNLTV